MLHAQVLYYAGEADYAASPPGKQASTGAYVVALHRALVPYMLADKPPHSKLHVLSNLPLWRCPPQVSQQP